MFYNSKNKALIVRDMNRVGKFTMSDRREDANKSSIKCYIYPKRVLLALNDTSAEVVIPKIVITETPKPEAKASVETTHGASQEKKDEVQRQEMKELIIIDAPILSSISFTYNNASEIVQHFISQRDLSAQLVSKKTLRV